MLNILSFLLVTLFFKVEVLKDDTNKDFTTSGEVMLEFHIVQRVAVLPPYQLHSVLKHFTSVCGLPIEEEC